MKVEEAYKVELKQSGIDHHMPTAGAMVDHIIVNLLTHTLKIDQAKFLAKGPASLFLEQHADEWIRYERSEFNQLNQILVNNGESVSTTIDQFKECAMLKENGASKYEDGQDQFSALVEDFDTQILSVTKTIASIQGETWSELSVNLIELLAWIKEQIYQSQNFLSHELCERLYTEEDDNDDDF